MQLVNDIKNGSFHCIRHIDAADIKKAIGRNGIFIRKVISPLLRLIYRTQTEYKIVKETSSNRVKGNRKIFIVNHRQSDDIVLSAIMANCNAWFVFGNDILLFESLTNGFGLAI